MHERRMFISNIFKEMNLVLSGKNRCCDAVDRGVSPPLHLIVSKGVGKGDVMEMDLVVKSTLGIQVFEELGVGFALPEIHIRNLKVTPD